MTAVVAFVTFSVTDIVIAVGVDELSLVVDAVAVTVAVALCSPVVTDAADPVIAPTAEELVAGEELNPEANGDALY